MSTTVQEAMNVLQATARPKPDSRIRAFRPRVINGARAAFDLDALMAAAAVFEGYDSLVPAIDDSTGAPVIWDDALDIRTACL
jgi:hypothetical protein